MSDEPQSMLRSPWRLPLMALAVLVVLVDDAFRAVVLPPVRALSRLQLVQKVEAAVARLPAYGVLTLFLVPLAIIEPLKIYGLFLFGQGRFALGIAVFVVAKVVGLGLAERLFAIGRGKLLSIRWFAACHAWLIAMREKAYRWLKSTRFWPQAQTLAARARSGLRIARRRLTSLSLRIGTRSGLVAAARRQLLSLRNREPF
jgi:hypothetical protein